MHRLSRVEVWSCKEWENEKSRDYTGRNRSIGKSNKTLWELDSEITLGLEDWSIREALFTWNDQNNTESVRYEMKKNEATIPKKTGSAR